MNTNAILAQVDAEIARLTQVRSLLTAGGTSAIRLNDGKSLAALSRTRKKHVLSPEARKRIADAQRKRWAAQKAKGK